MGGGILLGGISIGFTPRPSWDKKLLAEQFRELCEVELDFNLEATGFEVGEIVARLSAT